MVVLFEPPVRQLSYSAPQADMPLDLKIHFLKNRNILSIQISVLKDFQISLSNSQEKLY